MKFKKTKEGEVMEIDYPLHNKNDYEIWNQALQ